LLAVVSQQLAGQVLDYSEIVEIQQKKENRGQNCLIPGNLISLESEHLKNYLLPTVALLAETGILGIGSSALKRWVEVKGL
jgi:hypothetical protein